MHQKSNYLAAVQCNLKKSLDKIFCAIIGQQSIYQMFSNRREVWHSFFFRQTARCWWHHRPFLRSATKGYECVGEITKAKEYDKHFGTHRQTEEKNGKSSCLEKEPPNWEERSSTILGLLEENSLRETCPSSRFFSIYRGP